MKYFGCFEDFEQMLAQWGKIVKTPIPASDERVLFASYGTNDYEGDAIVLFTHEGKLYEVNGGHCSCHGLESTSYEGEEESQWAPEETSWEALRMRTLDPHQHESGAIHAFGALVTNP